jgi:putrescine transport system permease protein
MSERPSIFLMTILCFGIAVLYVPMLVLISYSFNASELVNVWGGFSGRWYAELVHNRQILDAAALSLEVGVVASTARSRSARSRLSRWCGSQIFAAACC